MTWTDPDDTDETPGWTPPATTSDHADDPNFDDFETMLDILIESGSRADDVDFERQDEPETGA